MINLQVVTCTNRDATESYYIPAKFRSSLKRFGVEPKYLGWQEKWGGLITKPRKLREWLRKGDNTSENLIVVDSWDLVFAEHPENLYLHNLPDDTIIFNGELACWPLAELADKFPDVGPYRFLNSGFFMGKADKILALLESMNLDDIPDDHQRPDGSWENPNDQAEYQKAFVKQPVPMEVDANAVLCQTLSGGSIEDFDFSEKRIRNKRTGTWPSAFHFNGKKELLMAPILKHLGL